MYQPRHFAPWEYLPDLSTSITWDTLAPELRKLLDDRLLETCDDIREILAVPCTINTYGYGGPLEYCGYRPASCGIGAPRSYHRKGMAADLHPHNMTAEVARSHIRAAVAAGKLPHLGGVELDVSWVHADTRPRVNGGVLWFKP